MVESGVVVSDISSVLWWAQFVGGKTVISLDLFGYRGGSTMRHYQGVRYFDSVAALDAAAFDGPEPAPAGQGLPTLTECLAALGP